MNQTFTNITDYTMTKDGAGVREATVLFNLIAHDPEIDIDINFELNIEMDNIVEADIDWFDDDGNGKNLYAVPNSVTGTLSNEADEKELLGVAQYLKNRHYVVADSNDYYDSQEFYERFAGEEITVDVLKAFFNGGFDHDDIDDESISLIVKKVENSNIVDFKDTHYGDLSGQIYRGDIDVSGFNLKSLKGAPKEITGHFDISRNPNLVSLEFAPEQVYSLNMRNTGITNYEFLPKIMNHKKSNLVASFKNRENLAIELKFKLHFPELSQQDLYLKIFQETDNTYFLPEGAKDVFLF